MLRFYILGTLEIHTPTRVVRPRGLLQRALLVTLLARAQELVPAECLIGELWGEDPPARVENALQAHVSRLRSKLAALEPGAAASRLITHPSGYQLFVGDEELDAATFVRDLGRIRAGPAQDPSHVVRALRAMLSLWHGPVFGDAGNGPVRHAAAARYEESRIAALELLYDSELSCGNHRKIIPELQDLLAQFPFHEISSQQLMTALYRSGRQVDALGVYRTLSRRLNEEMGLEPSPAMRGYERAILDQDPALSRVTVPRRPADWTSELIRA
jgi:SARP family transcriptional regulator, regulator of embCAB operon